METKIKNEDRPIAVEAKSYCVKCGTEWNDRDLERKRCSGCFEGIRPQRLIFNKAMESLEDTLAKASERKGK